MILKKTSQWILLALLLNLGLSAVSAQNNHESQLWLSSLYKLMKKDKLSLSLYAEVRTREFISDIGGFFTGPMLSYSLHPNVELGIAAKYIYFDTQVNDLNLIRLEPQITFKWKKDLMAIDFRNRYENIYNPDLSDWNFRTRHRLRFKLGLDAYEFVKNIYLHNEYFYNTKENKYERNRFTPIGITWNLKPSYLATQYLIETRPQRTTVHAVGFLISF